MASPSDPVGFRPGSMHSIVYRLILPRKVLERFQWLQNDWVDFVASTLGQRSKIFRLEMEQVTFQASGVAENVFGAFLPIRNCWDTTVILSQLETSRPRGSERVAFMAFGNLRSLIRYGWLVLGKLDHFTAPAAGYRLHLFRKEISNVKVDHFRHNIIPSTRTRQSFYAPIPRDALFA
jgi:hypothetical protein